MRKARPITLVTAMLVTLACSTALAAPELSKEVKLKGEREAIVMAPNWRPTSEEAAITVLERAPDKAKKISFGLLMLAIEEGPESTEGIDWSAVRDNIVAAAKAAGSPLNLEVKETFTGAAGLQGRRLAGSTKVDERTVSVEMIALIAPKVLVPISSVGRTDDSGVAKLATDVAATVKIPAGP